MTSSGTTPGNTQQDEFYDSSPLESHLLYQAEILVNVPILRMPWETMGNRWLLLRTQSGRRLDEALQHGNLGGRVKVVDSNQSGLEWQSDNRGDFVVALLDRTPVVVLNQTCDVQTKHFLQIAPIFPINQDDVDDPAEFERLKRGDIFSAFWIKMHSPEIPQESYADLELIQAVHKSYINRVRPLEHFRLNGIRTRLLQGRITRYFGRPNSFDAHTESAPETGTYLCTACFYMDGRAKAVEVSAGGPLPVCEECGSTQWVIKGR